MLMNKRLEGKLNPYIAFLILSCFLSLLFDGNVCAVSPQQSSTFTNSGLHDATAPFKRKH